jgi:hypothetical protein
MEIAGARAEVKRTRPRRFAFLAAAAALLAVVAWSGCASTVTPPADPPDPIVVHLLSTGRHAGVLLPNGDGRTVEYGYGDWNWYALGKTDWWRAPGVVLWPSQGTLGRRYVRDADLAAMDHSYGGGTLEELRVSRASADRLLARLDAEFAAAGEPHYNETYDMSFVKHPDDFWGFHDCHDEVAEWLEELGCSVGWAPIRTGLRLETKDPRGGS